MALTLRLNGRAAQNLITSAWFNDFYNLFTGNMTDQPITFKPNVSLQAIQGALGNPTLALAAGTALGVGVYKYSITAVLADGGESAIWNQATITTTTNNQAVSLTAIPTGPTGTVARRIYRSQVGGSVLFYVATINDNTTTTYTDSLADANLGYAGNIHPSLGGALVTRDQYGSLITMKTYDGNYFGQMRLQSWGQAPFFAGSAALQAGTNLGVGVYKYVVTFVSGSGFNTGESLQSPNVSITTTTNNQKVALSGLPLGPQGTIQRNIYRTVVGGSTYLYLASIFDNTTTTYTDTTADGSLGSQQPPSRSTFGGTLQVFDGTGVNTLTIYNNGDIISNGTVYALVKTVRNGGSQGNTIFTGTNTPSSPGVGDIWIQA